MGSPPCAIFRYPDDLRNIVQQCATAVATLTVLRGLKQNVLVERFKLVWPNMAFTLVRPCEFQIEVPPVICCNPTEGGTNVHAETMNLITMFYHLPQGWPPYQRIDTLFKRITWRRYVHTNAMSTPRHGSVRS